ncbi:MAG TPA: DUF58 domain-containing protein, partial [bacterium]|nr:DUF58 domain-containing protein [bacterium]
MAEDRRLLDPAVLARLSNLYLVARTVVEGSLTGLHRSLHKGSSVEFAEHREYAPGDDPRYLDWRVFGRTDRLYVKTFREETNLKSLILLDASGSMAYRGRGLSKLEYAVYLAAGLSYLMVNQKDAVGLMVFDSAVRRMVKPASTSRHLHHLLEQLQVTAAAETTNLGEVLHTIAARARRRSLIILISDLLDDPERVLKGLVHFRHKYHEVLVFQVLDPVEQS